MSIPVGEMNPVKIRDVWPKEEVNFTPWMKEKGLALLLPKIGIDNDSVVDKETEVKCGDQNKAEADLVVTYRDGEKDRKVVIENQYEKNDPGHFGRLLMYAASQRASEVVWVVEDARREYIDTINWLNCICESSDVSFYLVTISLFRICDSAAAPVFDVVARPDDEDELEDNHAEERESRRLCLDFWQSCISDPDFVRALSDAGFTQRKVTGDRERTYTVRARDVWINIGVTTRDGIIKAAYYLVNASDARMKLTSQESLDKMREKIGIAPTTGKSDTKAYTTINFRCSEIDISAGLDQQEKARKWFAMMLPKMKVFLENEGIIKK